MSKTQGKSTKGRPGVMPAPKRAPNPRTPKPVQPRNMQGGDGSVEEAEGAQVAEGQVTDAAGAGTQSTGTGGNGNQP